MKLANLIGRQTLFMLTNTTSMGGKFKKNQDRVVAMCATNGLTRGIEVIDMGASLSTLVSRATVGMNFRCSWEPLDNLGLANTSTTSFIHRPAPAFMELDTKLSIFEIGSKVVDL